MPETFDRLEGTASTSQLQRESREIARYPIGAGGVSTGTFVQPLRSNTKSDEQKIYDFPPIAGSETPG